MQSNSPNTAKTRNVRVILIASVVLLLMGLTPVFASDDDTGTLTGTVRLGSASNENTVVYLKGVTGTFPAQAAEVALDQKDKVFLPHLLPLRVKDTVMFKNSDSFNHNVHAYRGRRSIFNVIQGIKAHHDWTPERAGVYLVLCDIHTNMSAFVFAFDHPFFASVDHPRASKAGEFKIEGIPEGTYTVVAVRDVDGRLKRLEKEISVGPGQTSTVSFDFGAK